MNFGRFGGRRWMDRLMINGQLEKEFVAHIPAPNDDSVGHNNYPRFKNVCRKNEFRYSTHIDEGERHTNVGPDWASQTWLFRSWENALGRLTGTFLFTEYDWPSVAGPLLILHLIRQSHRNHFLGVESMRFYANCVFSFSNFQSDSIFFCRYPTIILNQKSIAGFHIIPGHSAVLKPGFVLLSILYQL